ncbi:argininosuccinate lyase [Francisella philomiragia]|uniref:Argininosuccinate lyase n=1 Tax=Francisella philomiragia subsp. philomiragia (strain ATCC 25017 / CCUG 19701 / FSC 153 / O\|nr:argininosuccinate lyase [Francisella philomiragia]AJI46839.1 argininosuccinate lyase [Francisella philomiragia]AJI48634.1 argininosuccinate lyase [Francisella philomiragia]MBK2019768.1 argininosuccinate lyase [Francisella philomiragia]MBK2029778.1 argininosuccinate lyase [Francisella philomiragia]MBK2263714.1 argininosuccinate lyase [Francisella philomiragia]
MNKKLWQTETDKLLPIVEKYTVGQDYILDQKLLKYDLQASLAHAKMLYKMKVITKDELNLLKKGLQEIQELLSNNEFRITQDQEDGHTAIEQYLCTHYGEVGKKIHTGRSRNDQSLVMLRLFMIDKIQFLEKTIQENIYTLRSKASKFKNIPMPGYTHMQKAMPTTVATWLGSFADALADTLLLISATSKVINQNPLGSASGFGISNFKHDKEYTTELLGFNRTQDNPIYCACSRGYFEKLALQTFSNPISIYSRFANDMMLFTMAEFDYFSLSNSYTTGSSIMPQKRNYDLFEIMRGNAKLYQGYLQQITSIIDSVPSGYNRDYQLTKLPFFEAITLIEDTALLFNSTIKDLNVHIDKLEQAMTPDLYATEEVYKLVEQGLSFRDAYVAIKLKLNK